MKLLAEIWPHVTAALALVMSLVASGHAIIYKRDARAAIGWVGLIWVAPVVGALLYVLLGINRIKRKAAAMGDRVRCHFSPAVSLPDEATIRVALQDRPHLRSLLRLVDTLTDRPLVPGNRVTPLADGDSAFPAMLAAIDAAEHSVNLSTYIFDNDPAGRTFCDALGNATARGVEVRVLIDAVGARYSFPSMERPLRHRGVRTARFLPTAVPWRLPYMNLRNHRKLLVIDGKVGFTGGMNIRQGHLVGKNPPHPIRDLHFRLDGPVVGHLQEVFVEDWHYATHEILDGDGFFPPLDLKGPVLARGISDGPDEDLGKLRWSLLGAVACAQSSIRILTPYFIPDSAAITALNVAAMRGIAVDIVLPETNNLALVKWASRSLFWQLLEGGCRIHLSEGPFDHTKLVIVDGLWSLIGSANWDPRSLRLNFEFDVECYDAGLADELNAVFAHKLVRSREVTLRDVDARGLGARLRDGMARLFSPYL